MGSKLGIGMGFALRHGRISSATAYNPDPAYKSPAPPAGISEMLIIGYHLRLRLCKKETKNHLSYITVYSFNVYIIYNTCTLYLVTATYEYG